MAGLKITYRLSYGKAIFSKFVVHQSENSTGTLSHRIHMTPPSWLRGVSVKKPQSQASLIPSERNDKTIDKDMKAVFGPADPVELTDIARNLTPSYNFAAYVNQSPSLQKLVQLGVDLTKYEKKPNVAEFILRLDFDRQIKPYIQFLHDNGVNADDIGAVLTKNMLICRESMENLKVRINYLESKNFTPENIAAIITRNPYWLTTPVKVIDGRLGWFQKTYRLTGDEVRQVVNGLPQIVTFDLNDIKLKNFVFEMELGMNIYMIKSMLLKRPRLFVKSQKKIIANFEYVHNVMKIPLDRIHAQPDVLMQKTSAIKERHLFLESLGRAQYNPKLPGYISIDTLVHCDDNDFATNVAKSSLLTYNLFLKTL